MNLPNIQPLKLGELQLPPYQRPREMARIARMVREFEPNAVGIPLVSYRDGVHWIVDASHRVATLEEVGYAEWPFEVLTGLSYEEEALLFYKRNDMKQPKAIFMFNALLDSGAEREVHIQAIAAAHGWKIARQPSTSPATINAVEALVSVYDKMSPENLDVTLETLALVWPGDKAAVEGTMIRGFGEFFRRHYGDVRIDTLVKKLQKFSGGPVKFLGTAKELPFSNNATKNVCSWAAMTYNKGRQTQDELPVP